jgi:molybdopterin converting factor small subunit
MSQVRVPTPLRAYVAGQSEVEVSSASVAQALQELVELYPALRPHLFGEAGELRPYIYLFVNDQDIRSLHGEQTPLTDGDRLMILPSIAGGALARGLRGVDHNALRANQGSIIALLLAAFVLDVPGLAAGVGAVMLLGTLARKIGFLPVYWSLRRLRLAAPDILLDNPEPHGFSQGLGAVVLLGGAAAFVAGASALGWGLTWLVIALASLNLFGGFCAGCAVYYWFNRLGLPGFSQAPPPGAFPGRRPQPPVE